MRVASIAMLAAVAGAAAFAFLREDGATPPSKASIAPLAETPSKPIHARVHGGTGQSGAALPPGHPKIDRTSRGEHR